MCLPGVRVRAGARRAAAGGAAAARRGSRRQREETEEEEESQVSSRSQSNDRCFERTPVVHSVTTHVGLLGAACVCLG